MAPTEAKQIVVDRSYGGWGSITMGLLTPAVNAEKSYGILGFGISTTSPAYDAGEQSFVSKLSEMGSTTHTKYLAVSIWANKWGNNSQDKQIKIEFKQRAWGNFKTAWALPTEPTAALDPAIPFNTAGGSYLKMASVAGLGLYYLL